MRNAGLGSWIHKRRVKSVGKVAVVNGDSELTYDALAERIDRLANALAERGVDKGTRVAYLGTTTPPTWRRCSPAASSAPCSSR